jgi:RNA polymerase-binding transcription factor DksA
LPSAFVEDARQMLLEQRAFRVGQLARLDLTSGSTSHGDFDAARGQVDAMLREAAQRVLILVDEALLRIEQGTFGRCSRCGDQIPQHRLAALPSSTWCAPCHRTVELAGVGPHQATSHAA